MKDQYVNTMYSDKIKKETEQNGNEESKRIENLTCCHIDNW